MLIGQKRIKITFATVFWRCSTRWALMKNTICSTKAANGCGWVSMLKVVLPGTDEGPRDVDGVDDES